MDFYDENYEYLIEGVVKNKSKRCELFDLSIGNRLSVFSDISNKYIKMHNVVTHPDEYYDTFLGSSMFHEKFHHSEQALMYYLSSREGFKIMLETLRNCNASYLYGIVLDIYSERMLCGDCTVSLIGMQHSHDLGFLNDFSSYLQKKNIEPRANENLMLNTRVSVSKANKGGAIDGLSLSKDKNIVHEYDPDKENKIFQAYTKNLDTKKIIKTKGYGLSTYSGSFFLSREINRKEITNKVGLNTYTRSFPKL